MQCSGKVRKSISTDGTELARAGAYYYCLFCYKMGSTVHLLISLPAGRNKEEDRYTHVGSGCQLLANRALMEATRSQPRLQPIQDEFPVSVQS